MHCNQLLVLPPISVKWTPEMNAPKWIVPQWKLLHAPHQTSPNLNHNENSYDQAATSTLRLFLLKNNPKSFKPQNKFDFQGEYKPPSSLIPHTSKQCPNTKPWNHRNKRSLKPQNENNITQLLTTSNNPSSSFLFIHLIHFHHAPP